MSDQNPPGLTESQTRLVNLLRREGELSAREIAVLYAAEHKNRIGYGWITVTLGRLIEAGFVLKREGRDQHGPIAFFRLQDPVT